jgi:hypothetical protein
VIGMTDSVLLSATPMKGGVGGRREFTALIRTQIAL